MFTGTAETITQKLFENHSINKEQYEICKFGIQQGLTILLNIVTIIIVGIIVGVLWQAVLFMVFYFPLRSYAGGYHAKTSVRCYMYSILLIIIVLLAIKLLVFTRLVYIFAFLISFGIIFILAPVEDLNKKLDNIEKSVYKKRTRIVTTIEGMLFVISLFLKLNILINVLTYSFITMALILSFGKYKNTYLTKKITND